MAALAAVGYKPTLNQNQIKKTEAEASSCCYFSSISAIFACVGCYCSKPICVGVCCTGACIAGCQTIKKIEEANLLRLRRNEADAKTKQQERYRKTPPPTALLGLQLKNNK
jgi:hypothetical protein